MTSLGHDPWITPNSRRTTNTELPPIQSDSTDSSVATPNLETMTPEELAAYIANLQAQLAQAQVLINNQ